MSMEASQFDQLLAAIHGATGGGGGTTGGATEAKQPAVSPSQGAGVVDAGTQRMVLASDGPIVTALGTTTQTKATDGSATAWSMIQLLKGIFDKLLASIAVTNTPASATSVISSALEASHVLKNSAGSLVGFAVLNTKSSLQYILFMNSTTVPADGAVALLYPPIPVPANTFFEKTFHVPLTASTGIAISNSSTGTFTKTIGSADCIFAAQVQ